MIANSLARPEDISPIHLDWTLIELLAWIGADDSRCHDERLRRILDAIDRGAPSVAGRTVVLVRSLAVRLVAEPALGGVRIRDVLWTTAAADGGAERVLVAV